MTFSGLMIQFNRFKGNWYLFHFFNFIFMPLGIFYLCYYKQKSEMKKGIKKKVQYRNQKGKSKGSAIALAIVLSQWTWVYTYREDAWKFWVGLISSMFLFWTLIVPLGIWIWAIVDVCEKDQEWYKQYND